MPKPRVKVNQKALRAVLKSDPVDDWELAAAKRVCDAANRWAVSKPRSGKHPGDDGPHFEVVRERSLNRARYTVRPCTGFGTWIAMKDPAGFMACLDAERG